MSQRILREDFSRRSWVGLGCFQSATITSGTDVISKITMNCVRQSFPASLSQRDCRDMERSEKAVW